MLSSSDAAQWNRGYGQLLGHLRVPYSSLMVLTNMHFSAKELLMSFRLPHGFTGLPKGQPKITTILLKKVCSPMEAEVVRLPVWAGQTHSHLDWIVFPYMEQEKELWPGLKS